jgi:hypothetical protein
VHLATARAAARRKKSLPGPEIHDINDLRYAHCPAAAGKRRTGMPDALVHGEQPELRAQTFGRPEATWASLIILWCRRRTAARLRRQQRRASGRGANSASARGRGFDFLMFNSRLGVSQVIDLAGCFDILIF